MLTVTGSKIIVFLIMVYALFTGIHHAQAAEKRLSGIHSGPPAVKVRAMAEWEEVASVAIAWGYFNKQHEMGLYDDLAGIIKAIQQEHLLQLH